MTVRRCTLRVGVASFARSSPAGASCSRPSLSDMFVILPPVSLVSRLAQGGNYFRREASTRKRCEERRRRKLKISKRAVRSPKAVINDSQSIDLLRNCSDASRGERAKRFEKVRV